jgi:hypothetical protein
MAKKPKMTSTQLLRKLERLVASLERTLEEMAKSPELQVDEINRLTSNLTACTQAAQALNLANMSLRIALQGCCEDMWRRGKNRRDIQRIERLLDANAQLTHDWEDEREGKTAHAIGKLSLAISLYDDLARSPPVRRR